MNYALKAIVAGSLAATAGLWLFSQPAVGQSASKNHGHQNHETAVSAPYAGWQTRRIASLSDADQEQIASGAGWGLALPAELNGFPGPKHVLELAEALQLSTEQQAAFEALFADMQTEAQPAGQAYISAEAELDALFASDTAKEASLREAIGKAENARAHLRFTHLKTHLAAKALLTPEQNQRYQQLRGYASDDNPCASVPEGHDPALWRQHNGCQ